MGEGKRREVYYAGGLVNGAWVIGLFGDVDTELSIKFDGDEGIQLLAPSSRQ